MSEREKTRPDSVIAGDAWALFARGRATLRLAGCDATATAITLFIHTYTHTHTHAYTEARLEDISVYGKQRERSEKW